MRFVLCDRSPIDVLKRRCAPSDEARVSLVVDKYFPVRFAEALSDVPENVVLRSLREPAPVPARRSGGKSLDPNMEGNLESWSAADFFRGRNILPAAESRDAYYCY